jgi:hypothetical protein
MNDLGKHLAEMATAMNRVAQQSLQRTKPLSQTELETRIRELESALYPFVASFQRYSDPIGDADLDNDQPRDVFVKLGDCRNAVRVLLGAR